MLTEIQFSHKDKNGRPHLLYRCSCGNEKIIGRADVRSGNTISCGCIHRERTADATRTHGLSGTRFYSIYKNMINRCFNKNVPCYSAYGARGIKVCDKWHDFENFRTDMYESYRNFSKNVGESNATLERKNNNEIYSPMNCEWIEKRKQSWNRRSSVYLEYSGKRQCIGAWANELGLKTSTLWARLDRGWSIEKSILTPKLL